MNIQSCLSPTARLGVRAARRRPAAVLHPLTAHAHTSAKQASLYVGHHHAHEQHSPGCGKHDHDANHNHASQPHGPATATAVAFDPTKLRETVRRGDYEGYLCGLFMPSASREAYFAIRALNIEVAGVRDAARGNAQAAHMRMTFWRDFVEAVYSGAPNAHPLYQPLSAAVRAHGLTRRWFDRMIDARDADVDGESPSSLGQLEAYAEDTASSLLYLALETCGVRNDTADEAASHIGKAAGLGTVLRALPVHARLGQRYVPDDVMARHGLSHGDMLITPEEVVDDQGRSLDQLAAQLQPASSSSTSSSGSAYKQRKGAVDIGGYKPFSKVDPQQQEKDREALRAAAQKRLNNNSSNSASGASSSRVSASATESSASSSDSNSSSGGSSSSDPFIRRSPSSLSAPRPAFAVGGGPPVGGRSGAAARVMVVGGGRDGEDGDTSPPASSSDTAAAAAELGIVRSSSSSGTLKLDSVEGGGGTRRTAEVGSFASSMERLAAISEAKARLMQEKAGAATAAASASNVAAATGPSAPSSSLTDARLSAGIHVEHAPSAFSSADQAANNSSKNSSSDPPSSASASSSSPPPPPQPSVLVLTKSADTQRRIRAAVGDIAGVAQAHIASARALQAAIHHTAVPALLPAVPIHRFLTRLESQGNDVFAPGVLGPWRDTRSLARLYLQLDLLSHTLRGTY